MFRDAWNVTINGVSLGNSVDYALGLLADGEDEHFCRYSIDQYTHLGQRANSRIEGQHRALKAYLDSSKADFYTILTEIKHYMSTQYHSVTTEMDSQRTLKGSTKGLFFRNVNRCISRSYLVKLTPCR